MGSGQDALVGQAGTWTAQSTASASGGSYLYSSGSTEDVLTLHFEGTRVEIVYVEHAVFGTMAIEIDNTVMRTVVTTSETTAFDVRAVIDYLEPGTHVLRVYAVTGTIAVDAFYASQSLSEGTDTAILQSSLAFIPNTGQYDSEALFYMYGFGGTAFFYNDEIVLEYIEVTADDLALQNVYDPDLGYLVQKPYEAPDVATVTLQFQDANLAADLIGFQRLPGIVNEYQGDNPARWRSHLPTYAGIKYDELYPGVDLEFAVADGTLESTYTIAPGADMSRIRWRYEGVNNLQVDAETGNLSANVMDSSEIRTEIAPFGLQTSNGLHEVPIGYKVYPDGSIGFEVSNYDPTQPLTITPGIKSGSSPLLQGGQPFLVYSTYLGSNMSSAAIGVDDAGSAYVTGAIAVASGDVAAFVRKINPEGTTIEYTTILNGGSGTYGPDAGIDLILDENAIVYLMGTTRSPDFPTTSNAAYPSDPTPAIPEISWDDVFATKLDATGGLLYSTYLLSDIQSTPPDEIAEYASGVGIDNAHNMYVVWYMFQQSDIATFIAKINPSGGLSDYSIHQGDAAADIVVDGAGYIHFISAWGVNITLLNQNGDQNFSQFISGLGDGSYSPEANRIAVDGWGYIYVAVSEHTASTVPPLVNAYQSTHGGGMRDVFVARLSPDASQILYSTYLGGSGMDIPSGIAVGEQGQVYVTGYTNSMDFPTHNAIFDSYAGGSNDAFLANFNISAMGEESLASSTYLGGADADKSTDIALDAEGFPYLTGNTESADFPLVNPVISEPYVAGVNNIWVAKDPDRVLCLFTPIDDYVSTKTPSYRPQEALDMLAIASSNGLYFHAAPAMNAPKVATTEAAAPNPDYVPWGDAIGVWRRIAFNSSGQLLQPGDTTDLWLVWYQIAFRPYDFDSDGDGQAEVENQLVWVVAQIGDYRYYDTAAFPNGDPCSDVKTPNQVIFPYDREAAATYAIANTYQNQYEPPPDTYMTQRLSNPTILATFPSGLSVGDIPYGHFETRTILVHTGGKTGSAAFISQSIWMGGMPMTRDYIDASTSYGDCGHILSPQDIADHGWYYGWRHCTNTWGQGDGNQAWLNHYLIAPYYTLNVLPDVHEADEHDNGSEPDEHFPDGPPVPLNLLPSNSRGTAVPIPAGVITEVAVDSSLLGQVVNLRMGIVRDPVEVFALVKAVLTEGGLGVKGLIRYGDYAWINTGSATAGGDDDLTHGLLVAGWGEANDCPAVIGQGGQPVILDSINLFPTFEQSMTQIQNPVPYVVDFSWKIQQPIPRPFYCTRFDAQYSTTFYGGGTPRNWDRFDDYHDWYFFALPDRVVIEEPQALFADPEWVWDANAGVIP